MGTFYCPACTTVWSTESKHDVMETCRCGKPVYPARGYIQNIEAMRADDVHRLEDTIAGYRREIADAEQPIARALHFPYGDDITLPSTECAIGDNTVVSLAQIAEGYITDLEHENAVLRKELRIRSIIGSVDAYGAASFHCLLCGVTACGWAAHTDSCVLASTPPRAGR